MSLRRNATLSLCTLLAACVEKMGPVPPAPGFDTAAMQADLQAHAADVRRMERNCPWPDRATYAHAVPVRAASTAPDIGRSWPDGCAVIRFSVEANGAVTGAEIATENPAGTGRIALAVVQQEAYAPASTPYARFMVRIGLSHSSDSVTGITTVVR